MISVYLRSSSYNTYSLCEQQYFIEYVLGHKSPAGKMACKGTICHKCLEILACSKKAIQDGLTSFEDSELGLIEFDNIDTDEYINWIILKVWDYYHNRMDVELVEKDKKDINKWVWEAITYNNSCFDPRHRNIFWSELHFDIEIPHKWAEYYYVNPKDDSILYGQLSLKGTIDLITQINDETYEVVDWKFGHYRQDWATGQEKDYNYLCNDPQLRIYHYALKKTFPHVKYWILTMYFINAGGPFTVTLTDDDIIKTEEMLQKRFEHIKYNIRPSLIKDKSQKWKCSKICHFGKNYHPLNPTKTICEFINENNRFYGIDDTMKNYSKEGFTIGDYSQPGEVK